MGKWVNTVQETMIMGRYSGEPLDEIAIEDPAYLQSLLEKDTLEEEERETIQAYVNS
jgi:hypothetical protein